MIDCNTKTYIYGKNIIVANKIYVCGRSRFALVACPDLVF